MGLMYQTTVPLVFCLMSSKTSAEYRKFWNALKNLRPNMQFQSIMMDFELGHINEIKLAFPNTSIQVDTGSIDLMYQNRISALSVSSSSECLPKDTMLGIGIRLRWRCFNSDIDKIASCSSLFAQSVNCAVLWTFSRWIKWIGAWYQPHDVPKVGGFIQLFWRHIYRWLYRINIKKQWGLNMFRSWASWSTNES